SAPDGREVNITGSHTTEKHPAPSDISHTELCHCVCHLQRPGMRLVWVPLQEEMDAIKETSHDHTNSRPGNDLQKKEEGLYLSKSERVKPENASLPCLNCKSFLLQKLPTDGLKYTEGSTQSCFKPPLPPRTYRSSQYHNVQQYEQLDQPDGHVYLDLLPSNDKVTQPPVPPRPPSRKSTVNQKTGKRPSQPSLAWVVSPRGGYVPIPISVYNSRSTPVRNPEAQSYENESLEGWEAINKEELFESTGSPRRISSDWEPNSDYEPLYQIYQAQVTKEASQTPTESPDCYRRSVSETLGLEGPGGLGLGCTVSKRGPEDITLWQDLPVVKESGMLQKLSRTEKQRQESMFEVLTSEASYLRSLRVLKDHFLGSRELIETLVIHDKKVLFSNLIQVYEVSERRTVSHELELYVAPPQLQMFIKDLLTRVDESVVISDVCDIIYEHSEKHFSVYIDYVRNQQYQEKTYSRLMESNQEFSVVMKRLELSPLCKRLPFTSFMLLPFQRITRIKILIQSILKRTTKGSKEEETASNALASVSELITLANAQVGQMKQIEELINTSNKLEFDKIKAIPIISKTRCLEKHGELQELSKRASLFSVRNKCTPVYIFLFNDLLIFTTRKSGGLERFVVVDYAHRSLVQVQTTVNSLGPQLDHCFSLTLLENHRGNPCEHLLKANTESDMHRWIAAFPTIKATDNEEKIYEDWDCPQVQCVTQYKAKQADELSLEPADVINVLRKTSEGWYEGIRLCDGQKGWFPAENTLEVTTDHQRRRNVREKYQQDNAITQNSPS
ncbi:hypothetical protein DNTS_013487, partial [Danionella cerebrum]